MYYVPMYIVPMYICLQKKKDSHLCASVLCFTLPRSVRDLINRLPTHPQPTSHGFRLRLTEARTATTAVSTNERAKGPEPPPPAPPPPALPRPRCSSLTLAVRLPDGGRHLPASYHRARPVPGTRATWGRGSALSRRASRVEPLPHGHFSH